jgi:hypothetical protein
MLKNIDIKKVPKIISENFTISKDVLYKFCELCDEKDIEKLIAQKLAKKKAKNLYWKKTFAKMEKADDFFATV